MKYHDVLDKVVDSKDFTVGGGSASALAGAMAAGMSAMVARLSIAKPVNLTPADYESLIAECDKLVAELLDGSYKDTEAYCMIKDAYAMPKQTDEEKSVRSKAIQEAAYQAAVVPKNNAFNDLRAYQLTCKLEGSSNPNCLSDLLSAKYLSEAGVKGCILNIEANLSIIKDEGRIQELKQAMEDLRAGLAQA